MSREETLELVERKLRAVGAHGKAMYDEVHGPNYDSEVELLRAVLAHLRGDFVAVEFLVEGLGERAVRVHGPTSREEADERAKQFSRATDAFKVVELEPLAAAR